MSDDTQAKVLKQVEFYFSDSNLPRDKFLSEIATANDGWVPIETIASFARMKKISTDLAVIVEALRKSEGMLEVDEEGKKVRRSKPLPETDDYVQRCVYCKGLPKDSTIESVTTFFSQFGKVLSVRLRKEKDGSFKESAFIEFESVEKVAEVAAKKDLEIENGTITPLVLLERPEWEVRHAKNLEKVKGKRKSTDTKETEQSNGAALNLPSFEANKLISLKGLKETSREGLKEAFLELGFKVAYADYSIGQEDGVVRLEEPKAAEAVEAFNGQDKVKIGETVPTVAVITGEEEQKYWEEMTDRMKNARMKYKRGKRH